MIYKDCPDSKVRLVTFSKGIFFLHFNNIVNILCDNKGMKSKISKKLGKMGGIARFMGEKAKPNIGSLLETKKGRISGETNSNISFVI